jgi:uncharacterized protein YegL
VVVLVDTSVSQAYDSSGQLRADGCNVLSTVRSALGLVAGGLAARASDTSTAAAVADTVRVAVVTFARVAVVQIGFGHPFDAAAVAALDLGFTAGPTLADQAFEVARRAFLQPTSVASGFRPRRKVMVVFSDGESLNQEELQQELHRSEHRATATRTVIDTDLNRDEGAGAQPTDLFELMAKPAVAGAFTQATCAESSPEDIAEVILARVPSSAVGSGWECAAGDAEPSSTAAVTASASAAAATTASPSASTEAAGTTTAQRTAATAAAGTTATATATATPTATPTAAPTTTAGGAPATTAVPLLAGGATLQATALLADRSNVVVEGDAVLPVPLALGLGGGYLLGGAGGIRLTKHPPVVAVEWTIAMTVEQKRGTTGYLFAKTADSGDAAKNRYYALYAGSRSLIFYYATRAGEAGSVRFGTQLDRDERLRVTLAVASGVAELRVFDGAFAQVELFRQRLKGDVADCTAGDNCQFALGQRSGSTATAAGKFPFTGVLHEVTMLSNKRVREYPAAPRLGTLSEDTLLLLLSHARLDRWLARRQLNDGAVEPVRGVYQFDGTTGLRVTVHSAVRSQFTVAVDGAFASSGYVFAKTNAAGDGRYYSLYLSASRGAAVFYYQIRGDPALRSHVFAVNLSDGRRYQLVLSIDGAALSLRVDGVRMGAIRQLGGSLDDCGPPSVDCVLYLGQRSSAAGGAFAVEGEFYDGRLLDGLASELYPRLA